MSNMAHVDQFLRDEAKELYLEAIKLNDEASQTDPENEPYKSKYKAREIWHDLLARIERNQADNPQEIHWLYLASTVHLKLGENYAETEEVSTGEDHLSRCVKAIEPHRLEPIACNVLQNALNQLGILWTGRGQSDTSLEYLRQAETLYKDFKHNVGNAPWTVSEVFQPRDQDADDGAIVQKRSEAFENAFTHTLYYLAQVFAKMEENTKSAEYCHATLQRQLETGKYNPLDWSMNAATLSQFYLSRAEFHTGRHCLASAELILREAGEPSETLQVVPNAEESQDELTAREKIPRSWADIYRCWTKYALALLEHSKERLECEDENPKEDGHNKDKQDAVPADDTGASSQSNSSSEKKEDSCLFNLELTSIENEVTADHVLTFDQAREVFCKTQKWINSAKEFYILEGHCTDHCELIQDHTRLYRLLAFFEPDFDRQCKMHKRRADLLQAILREISPQHYLLVCRVLIYELAETYSTMMDTKLAILDSQENLTVHARQKINQLVAQSIEQYQTYIDTLKDPGKPLPAKFSEEDERPAIVAHFCIGRLYSKFFDADVAKRLDNIKKSMEYYKFIVDYGKKNPESVENFKAEAEICEEMVTLLPAKMDKIKSDMDGSMRAF